MRLPRDERQPLAGRISTPPGPQERHGDVPALTRRPLSSAPVDERLIGELPEVAANGDEPSWSELVDRFSVLVWSVARTVNLDRASVEDVTQAVWLRFAEH